MPAVLLSPIGMITQLLTDQGIVGAGFKLNTYVGGTVSTPQTTYTDSTGTVTNTNPIVLGSNGRFQSVSVWAVSGTLIKMVITDSLNNLIAGGTIDNIPLINDPASFTSSGLGAVLYPQTAAEIAASVTPTNYTYPSGHAWRYGADPTGAVNATTALLNMYTVCIGNGITTGCNGYIPPGNYKVTTGVLVFDNGFVRKAWPNIATGGYWQTIFTVDAATATNAPILTWKNGTANSTAGNYWNGGSHGGLTFQDATGAVAPLRSAISMAGVWAMQIGYMYGVNLRGDVLTIPRNLYQPGVLDDPDPYAVTDCFFDGIEANACQGAAINNLNYVGFVGNTVKTLTVFSNIGGGWLGLGAINVCITASMTNNFGWMFDDGTMVDHTGGSASKFTLMNAELDNCQNMFRFNACLSVNIYNCRIVHRYQYQNNVGAFYWPLIGVQFAAGAAASVQQVNIQMTHRLNSGGTHANIGTWVDFANAGGAIQDVQIDHVLDNQTSGGGLITILDSDYFTNLNTNTRQVTTVNGKRVADTRIIVAAMYYGDGTTQLAANGNYTTAAAKILFPVVDYDAGAYVATSVFTAPFSGPYELRVRVCITAAAGTKINLGVFKNGTTMVLDSKDYAVTATVQSYEVTGVVQLLKGDTLYAMGDNSTAGAIVVSAPISQITDNIFQVRAL